MNLREMRDMLVKCPREVMIYILLYHYIHHYVYERWFRGNETTMNISKLISLLYFRTTIEHQTLFFPSGISFIVHSLKLLEVL